MASLKLFVSFSGGFSAFQNLIPEWFETGSPDEAPDSDLSLENLRITPLSETASSDSEGVRGDPCCDSGLDGGSEASPSNDPPFPVEILPYLFLGNAENSADLEALQRHKIRYVLNVTPNLPNAFEDKGLGIKYMKIPIQDHWSQNLATFFPEAIAFIGKLLHLYSTIYTRWFSNCLSQCPGKPALLHRGIVRYINNFIYTF